MLKDLKDENSMQMPISVACIVFSFFNGNIEVLLCKESNSSGSYWSLPISWLMKRENLDNGARRLVKELTGLDNTYMEQVKAFFGNVDCAPVEEKITIGYLSLIDRECLSSTESSSTNGAQWFKIEDLPELKSEHTEIMSCNIQHIKELALWKPIVFNLLPQSFTFMELTKIYEEVLGIKLEKSNFRNKVLKLKILNELKEKRKGSSSNRKASLFSFNPVAYNKIQFRGFNFGANL